MGAAPVVVVLAADLGTSDVGAAGPAAAAALSGLFGGVGGMTLLASLSSSDSNGSGFLLLALAGTTSESSFSVPALLQGGDCGGNDEDGDSGDGIDISSMGGSGSRMVSNSPATPLFFLLL